MSSTITLTRPELSELVALSELECKQIPVVTPSVKMMEKLGVWIFRNDTSGRLWLGLREATAHLEDRWLYRSALPGESDYRVAFWHGLGHAHSTRDAIAPEGDIDPYLALQTFNSNAVNTNRMLRMLGFPEADPARLLSFFQLSGFLGVKAISHMPEHVNWALLHELLWHLDEWRAANEAVDMPLHLILRMCGFHSMAEAGVRFAPGIGFVWHKEDDE